MKLKIEEVMKQIERRGKSKVEQFLDENREVLKELVKRGFSDSEIAYAVNSYLQKMRRAGEKLDVVVVKRKVLFKYLQGVREELGLGKKERVTKEKADKKERKTEEKKFDAESILLNRETEDF